MTRIIDFCKGLIGLALIIVLLVGIPALLLVIVGYPLPTRMPSLDVVRAHVEDGDIPDPFLIKTLALVVWFVWAQLAVATLVELAALARGRISARAPVLPGIQLFAGKLVASTVLIVSALTPGRSLAAAPIVAPEAVEVSFDTFSAGAGQAAEATSWHQGVDGPGPLNITSEASDAVRGGSGFYTTRSGDSWWDVAERLLGDGMRWSELRALNSGVTTLTGEVIDERTESVKAGWRLSVPADADERHLDGPSGGGGDPWSLVDALRPESLVYEGPTGVDRAGRGPAYQVVEGDNLWDIAERHLGDPFRWPEIYEASTDLTQTFGRRITDPNLIWPDSILVLPSDAVDVPTAAPELVGEVLGQAADPRHSTDADTAEADGASALTPDDLHRMAEWAAEAENRAEAESGEAEPTIDPIVEVEPVRAADPDPGGPDGSGPDPGPGVPDDGAILPGALAIAAGGALLSTGLLGMLRRARRLRLAETGEASIPERPPVELAEIETVLRNRADRVALTALDDVVASLGSLVTRADEPTATPEIIRVAVDRVEAVVLDTGGALPAPWYDVAVAGTDLPSGRRVVAAAMADLESVVRGRDPDLDRRPDSTPTLVTVGDGLLVNLEAVGVFGIAGRPDSIAALARTIVHELTGRSFTGIGAQPVEVVVSDRIGEVEPHPEVRSISIGRVVAQLEPWLEQAELRLAASGAGTPWGLRLVGDTSRSMRPVVVVIDGSELVAGSAAATLVDRARDRRLPLAVVVVGPVDDPSVRPSITATVDADQVRLDPLGVAAVALDVDIDLVLGVEALIDHARRAPIVPRPEIAWGWPELDADDGPLDRRSATLDGWAEGDPAQRPTEETPEHEIVTELPSEDEREEVTDRSDEDESGLLIRVLGQVVVEGGPDDLSEVQVSILAFLALAGPSTVDQIGDAVVPGDPDGRRRLDAELADLGRRLGPLFPQAGDGRHRVRSTISDLGSARRWITQASALTEERARNLLQLALSEVRGRPFSGVPARYWQWIEDHRLAVATQATSLLMDACFDLCDGAYRADDVHLSLWACEVASRIDPLQETVVTRQVQLLSILGRGHEAAAVVDRWEAEFALQVGRPAPRSPRLALEPAGPPVGEAVGVAAGHEGTERDEEVTTHVG